MCEVNDKGKVLEEMGGKLNGKITESTVELSS